MSARSVGSGQLDCFGFSRDEGSRGAHLRVGRRHEVRHLHVHCERTVVLRQAQHAQLAPKTAQVVARHAFRRRPVPYRQMIRARRPVGRERKGGVHLGGPPEQREARVLIQEERGVANLLGRAAAHHGRQGPPAGGVRFLPSRARPDLPDARPNKQASRDLQVHPNDHLEVRINHKPKSQIH